MANIGYIQVVRHCNHLCGFCSNPTTPYVHSFETMKVLVDDFVDRDYFGIILTGGEPSLHPELPEITKYARDKGLHVRMITNGHRMADPKFAKAMADAGLQHIHVSVYSVREEVEAQLRGMDGTLKRAFRAMENANEHGVTININSVINKLNCDHLHENIAYFIEHHPYIRHFVWNNLDPSMGRAEVNQDQFLHKLRDFEWSLHEAMRMLDESGRTFRVEKVPLCYMSDYGWASTETRKIVKGEERIVHFLDDKQTVRQTDWDHMYAADCVRCSLRPICGGLFDHGDGYDSAELSPVFEDMDRIVERIIRDPADPSYAFRSLGAWKRDFARRLDEARDDAAKRAERRAREKEKHGGVPEGHYDRPDNLSVGRVTADGLKLWQRMRNAEQKRAERVGVRMETEKLVEKAKELAPSESTSP